MTGPVSLSPWSAAALSSEEFGKQLPQKLALFALMIRRIVRHFQKEVDGLEPLLSAFVVIGEEQTNHSPNGENSGRLKVARILAEKLPRRDTKPFQVGRRRLLVPISLRNLKPFFGRGWEQRCKQSGSCEHEIPQPATFTGKQTGAVQLVKQLPGVTIFGYCSLL